ncbi:hypothetical protein [Burkholderia multivorans]|uniref:hypothetical protein n=1 Tax=Burkholderia multivorans TaxID=87883 RepID=UPI0011B27F4D|nr:hypothetical protein [Burkholderia multivorans]MBU9589610.1 hypothetical protein [Burkholderia multivorans]
MSQKQKKIEQAIKDVRNGKRTFSQAEIEELKRTVASQRGTRSLIAKSKCSLPAIVEYHNTSNHPGGLERRLPGSFESKK